MIQEITGDITELPFHVDMILQNCNNCCTQGSGVALALRTKWPEVFEADKEAYRSRANRLGDISIATVVDDYALPLQLINLYGQTLVRDRKRQLNYEALYVALETTADLMQQQPIRFVAVPEYMGAGLAGGNWNIVLAMLKVLIENNCKVLYVVKFNKK